MSLPTPAKTWNFDINHTQTAQGSALSDNRLLMYNIKQSMAANGWTVVRSSDASSVSNTDRWTGANSTIQWNQNNGTSPHSWIVLKNASILTNFEICIDLQEPGGLNIQTQNGTIAFCENGYDLTTGTVNVRPSASGGDTELVLISSTTWGGSSTDVPMVWHAMYSSDHQCTRIVIMNNNIATGFWLFDVPQNPGAGWTNAHAGFATGADKSAAITNANLFTSAKVNARMTNGLGTTNTVMYMGTEGYNNARATATQTAPNDTTGNYPITPIGLWSDTVNTRGRNGQLFDLWYGEDSNPSGLSYPASGTLYQFVQLGSLIFPWQSSTAPITG